MELSLWKIILLAGIQGATEFLPVSSSGHLVVVAAMLTQGGSTEGLEIPDLSVVLHGGTLVAILVYYFRRILRLLTEDRRTIGLVAVGTLPAVLVGVPLELYFEEWLADPLLAGILLPVTGIILLAVRGIPVGDLRYNELTFGRALLIGVSQAIAILPGLSRSGATISAGIGLGLTPRSAATFSFLLAIPAIGGACFLKAVTGLGETGQQTPTMYLAVGAGVSFLVGLASLSWLLRWLERGRFHYFAWWCIPLGVAVIAWRLTLSR